MQLFRKLLLIFLLGFLFIPITQTTFHLINVTRLSGAYTLSDDTACTINGWLSGKFQEHKELFLRDTFGLRNLFIRTINQTNYSLFDKSNARDVVVGKNDYLFNRWYIDAYVGADFTGTNKISNQLKKLKVVQDSLTKMNKTLLVVFAPSKDLFAPEHLPEGCIKGDSTNYDVFIKLAKEYGINFIDFNPYFISLKNKSEYLLYTKYGSHWSAYGACIAGDTITSMFEKLSHTPIPHTIWKDNIIREGPNGSEIELENELNLLFNLKHDAVGHPQLKNPADSSMKKTTLMMVGDSYIWNLVMNSNFWNNFSSFTFCYYYNTVYTPGKENKMDSTTFNLRKSINDNDVFLIEATESNLPNFGFGFIDAATKVLGVDTAAGK